MEFSNSDPNPVFVIEGKNFVDELAAQIVICIFLGIAYFEYILQTLLIVYVFLSVLLSSKKIINIMFVIFGCTIFLILRITLIPVLLAPLPFTWAPTIPYDISNILFYFNIVIFTLTYGCSVFGCVYFIIYFGITRSKMKGNIHDPKTGLMPMVVILMPIYNEDPEALSRAVESAIRCDYHSDRKHVFLAFDDEEESPLFFALLKKLRLLSKEISEEIMMGIEKGVSQSGTQKEKKLYIFPPRLEWIIEGVRVTICRFPHEGKSPTQGKSFRVINDIYGSQQDIAENTLVLFIDSDIILHDNSIYNFVITATKNPKIKGITGLVTCRTSRKFNVYQYLQDAEYVDGQMFIRSAEAVMGSVSCLPGALTLIRLSALQKVAPKYFIEFDNKKSIDFHRYHLGEDRYMTYLLTELSNGPYQVTFVSSAQCKTDAPDTFSKLLKQRRRWFLGGLLNDICMLSSPLMWRRLPFMTLFKMYFYSTKGVDWLFGILVVSLVNGKSPGILLYIIFGTLVLKYTLLCLNAFLLTRKKICIYSLFLFFVSPFFQLTVTIYSIWTWNVRSWGGPRTDNTEEIEEQSKVYIIQEVMKQHEERRGQTRKSLAEIKTMSRIIDRKLEPKRIDKISSNIPSIVEIKGDTSLKKFVPFPYEMEFLGGGEFNTNFLQPMASGSSLLNYSENNSTGMYGSSSMPDLSTLEGNYLIRKLDSNTLERAASFRLDKDYLARVEDLATYENSLQRNSSFNSRLSGRSSTVSYSRELSVNGSYHNKSEESISSIDDGIVINFNELT